MNDSKMDDKELVSALADGQLDAHDMARCLQALAADSEARERWDTYHLIGDVLRTPELAACTPSTDFARRVARRLAAEPAPVRQVAEADRDSANDGRFTWRIRMAAGFASLAVVGLVTWVALGAAQDPAQDLAQVPAQGRLALELMPPRVGMVVTPSDKGPMLRDPVLDEMLATHRQMGDVTALQAPAAGLHNATFEPAHR